LQWGEAVRYRSRAHPVPEIRRAARGQDLGDERAWSRLDLHLPPANPAGVTLHDTTLTLPSPYPRERGSCCFPRPWEGEGLAMLPSPPEGEGAGGGGVCYCRLHDP